MSYQDNPYVLTHWCRVMHICVIKLINAGICNMDHNRGIWIKHNNKHHKDRCLHCLELHGRLLLKILTVKQFRFDIITQRWMNQFNKFPLQNVRTYRSSQTLNRNQSDHYTNNFFNRNGYWQYHYIATIHPLLTLKQAQINHIAGPGWTRWDESNQLGVLSNISGIILT